MNKYLLNHSISNIIQHEKSVRSFHKLRALHKKAHSLYKLDKELRTLNTKLRLLTERFLKLSFIDKQKGFAWNPVLYCSLFEKIEILKEKIQKLKKLRKNQRQKNKDVVIYILNSKIYLVTKKLLDIAFVDKQKGVGWDPVLYCSLFEKIHVLKEKLQKIKRQNEIDIKLRELNIKISKVTEKFLNVAFIDRQRDAGWDPVLYCSMFEKIQRLKKKRDEYRLRKVTKKLLDIAFIDKQKGGTWNPKIYCSLFEKIQALKRKIRRYRWISNNKKKKLKGGSLKKKNGLLATKRNITRLKKKKAHYQKRKQRTLTKMQQLVQQCLLFSKYKKKRRANTYSANFNNVLKYMLRTYSKLEGNISNSVSKSLKKSKVKGMLSAMHQGNLIRCNTIHQYTFSMVPINKLLLHKYDTALFSILKTYFGGTTCGEENLLQRKMKNCN